MDVEGDLKDDNARVKVFLKSSDEIADYVNLPKNKNDIENFYFFPYTLEFAKNCIIKDYIDGILVYRNQWKNPMIISLKNTLGENKKCITIRPFNSGKVT